MIKGLIIKEDYLQRFFNNNKTAEVRSQDTKIRGKILLCCSKKHEIWGEAELYDVLRVLQCEYETYTHLHKSNDFDGYPVNYLWLMKNIKKYPKPKSYQHKPGCVIWINLKLEE